MNIKAEDAFRIQNILHDILTEDAETPQSDRDWIKDVRKQYNKLRKRCKKYCKKV